MKCLIRERLSEHKYKTPEGYLICVDSILARTGKQTYRRSELFQDGDDSEVDVDRPENEVFSPATLASFENKPIVVEILTKACGLPCALGFVLIAQSIIFT